MFHSKCDIEFNGDWNGILFRDAVLAAAYVIRIFDFLNCYICQKLFFICQSTVSIWTYERKCMPNTYKGRAVQSLESLQVVLLIQISLADN